MLTLKCTFDTSFKQYSYLYDGDEEVEAGDLAVVDSPYGGPKLVTIRSVDYGNTYGPHAKKVLAVVSMAAKRREQQIAKRKADLTRQLKSKLNSTEGQMLLFASLAKVDKEAAVLFEELKQLS
jgi:hypothetical protein